MALEWLKNILKDTYTDEIDKAVAAEIGKGFVSKADFNTLNETKKKLETDNADLKKIDGAALQADNEKLKGENATLQLGRKLDAVLYTAQAKNVTAVGAMLDMSKISLDESGNLVGADDQIKALQQSQGWAFAQASVPGSGGNPPAPDQGAAEVANMRAAAGLSANGKTA